ncbi:uracil-xanthine permease family protein [Amycolatopsis alkalitolerans]|uniref:Permease n=1 Tax=Amycolatopsis alkalitolerans TaxID=2547244 RepID=A0A5C4LV67_9PSEU|nr:solute carrier family 23 protein [Amycolatopsis alkalitolerans]TNC22908.1 permease [Amycolatopsis alkalitolerans]
MAVVNPADERIPIRTLAPLAVQHLLVMITGPISSVFLVAHALKLDAGTSAKLLAAFFLVSAIGTALQSTGRLRVGARLPFVMLPGGAAVVLFIQIAQETGARTATGAVLLTAVVTFALVPVFLRIVRLFPPLVLGVMVIVIGVNLLRITAKLVLGPDGTATRSSLWLMVATIVVTVLLFRFLRGGWRRVAILLGMVVGALLGLATGQMGAVAGGPAFAWPQPFVFGAPRFDVLATLPLLVFAIGAMAEATGQTVLNTEAVGKKLDRKRDIGGVLRGDAVTSLVSGLFGGPVMVTSGENIGIVRITGVRSRFVTLGTAVLLAVIAFLAPVARLINAVPAAVVCGTGLVVFGMITGLGIKMLHEVDFGADPNLMVATAALVAGLLPVVAPNIYQSLPTSLRLVLGSGVTMAALVGVLGNLLFHRLSSQHGPALRRDETAEPARR